MAVVASLAMSPIGAIADEHCGEGLFQTPCLSPEEEQERADKAAEAKWMNERDEQYMRDEAEAGLYEQAAMADDWANTYLGAEKAVAVYWRDAYVEHEANRKRIGSLRGPDEQVINYTCDINYGDTQSGGCVPADRDYDCWELRSWGIVGIPVRTPTPNTNPPIRGDWMLLDDDHDGLGCEYVPD